MSFFLMTMPAAAFLIAATCPEPTPIRLRVGGRVGEIEIGTAFDLAQLRELSGHYGRKAKHIPFGFYASQISGETAVTIGNDRQDVCAGPIEIAVTIELAERHIQIGRDLRDDNCQFNAALKHYQLHAEADVAVLRHYVAVVTQTLAQAPLAGIFGAAGKVDSRGGSSFAPAVQAFIEPVLDEMRAEQASAIDAVDTPIEIRRLEQACHGQL